MFAWLVARQTDGQFVLRIEDTDKNREVAGSENHIFESLNWLGLEWDEGPDKGGAESYRQSERLPIYRAWAKKLLEGDRAYADPYSPEELNELRRGASAAKQPFLFREHRPQNPPAWTEGRPLRFKSDPKIYEWKDAVMGELSTGPEAVDDYILIKSDGFPTYNFAHIIDDYLMNISHVIRSQEFLPSVPKFLNLYEALNFTPPILATLPYVMRPDGKKKLSKRDGAKDILDYRNEGYLPAALINFLATLGWNDGSEQEIFSLIELEEKFSLDRVQKSGARFDEERLRWMNGHYIRHTELHKLQGIVEEYWPAPAKKYSREYRAKVLGLIQERLKYFAEIPELSHFFFTEPEEQAILNLYKNPTDKQLKEKDSSAFIEMLKKATSVLEQSDFKYDDIVKRLNETLRLLNTKPAMLFPVIRIAITGSKNSPELFGTLVTLGKETGLKRLRQALGYLEKQT